MRLRHSGWFDKKLLLGKSLEPILINQLWKNNKTSYEDYTERTVGLDIQAAFACKKQSSQPCKPMTELKFGGFSRWIFPTAT